ncbi:MAG: metallophosphoesterase [Carboxylicivirga sp.]|jgi:hypothetical protein|nr:metallophosphoesterase [Carboxylicivirga sp.]
MRKIEKRIVTSALILCIGLLATAQKDLRFNGDGSFKIVQFTDTHFQVGTSSGDSVIALLTEVLEIEKPNLVVFSGDVVTYPPFDKGWKTISEPMIQRAIPWAVTFGNHDDDHAQPRGEILPIIKKIPFCLAKEGGESVHGHGNYVLPLTTDSGNKVAALIYCMDSNKYPVRKGYLGHDAWFDYTQVNWYRQMSQQWTEKNNGSPIPGVAFFHIPLPEYALAWKNSEIESIGVKNEKVCCPVLNTGMFAAMVEQGDVMGTFVGHDHVNDFLVSYYGIALAYGRFSGGSNTYGNLLHGARVIVLKEGERQFTTWIRLRGGEKINTLTFHKKQL